MPMHCCSSMLCPAGAGIDIDGSRHVGLRDVEVDTADDAICLKTTTPGWPLEHVTVSDCRWVAEWVAALL